MTDTQTNRRAGSLLGMMRARVMKHVRDDQYDRGLLTLNEFESVIRADERARAEALAEALRPFAALKVNECYCEDYWLRDYDRHGPNCFWAENELEIAAARAALADWQADVEQAP